MTDRWTAAAAVLFGTAAAVPTGWWITRDDGRAGQPLAQAMDAVASPSRTPSTSPTPVAPPVGLRLPSADVDAEVTAVGVDPDGRMTIPADARRVGWYRFGAAPGADRGSAVIAGHVDATGQGPGALFRLRRAGPGDAVQVIRADGSTVTYRVVTRDTVSKQTLPVDQLFDRASPPRLVLLTCSGPFDRERRSYRDNVVVVAEPVR